MIKYVLIFLCVTGSISQVFATEDSSSGNRVSDLNSIQIKKELHKIYQDFAETVANKDLAGHRKLYF